MTRNQRKLARRRDALCALAVFGVSVALTFGSAYLANYIMPVCM